SSAVPGIHGVVVCPFSDACAMGAFYGVFGNTKAADVDFTSTPTTTTCRWGPRRGKIYSSVPASVYIISKNAITARSIPHFAENCHGKIMPVSLLAEAD